MMLLLAIIAVQSGVIVWLWRSRNKAWRENARNAGAWHGRDILRKQEIARWCEEANKSRRNTGKAEL